MTLIWGALLGFISVAFGAYAEHGLRPIITDEHFRFLMTAIRYNQVHAAVIVAIGLALGGGGTLSRLPILFWSGVLFVVGTVLFSFSIYVSVAFDIPALLNLTPLGGITLMFSWLLLLAAAVKARGLS